jgi:hypothetical protein
MPFASSVISLLLLLTTKLTFMSENPRTGVGGASHRLMARKPEEKPPGMTEEQLDPRCIKHLCGME